MTNLLGNNLNGYPVEMYDAETKKLIRTFDSINKVSRFFGFSKGSQFNKYLNGKEILESNGKKYIFKEKLR